MVRVVYACRDGSPFPVDFAAAEDAQTTWIIDREHAPEAMTPLADAVRRTGRAGEVQAYADCGVAMPAMLRRDRPVANGYAYHLDAAFSAEEWDRLGHQLLELARAHDGTLGVWRDHCLPRVVAACAWLRDAEPDTPFAALAVQRELAWGFTSVAGLVARIDEMAVAASCSPAFGARATLIAYELAQGSVNETIVADQAIGRLARLEPGSNELAVARAEFLAGYGLRSVSWSIDHPTAAERPELLDDQIRLLRRHGGSRLDVVGTATAARRGALVAEVEAALADDDARARFRRRLERLAAFVPVREARARWQLVATGAMRHAVQRRGQLLVERGVLDHRDDVFLLEPDEYDAPVGPVRGVVAERRVEHRHWSAVTPPIAIGGAPRTAERPEDPVVRGVPGASGHARGRARVILDLGDIDRFEPGDVLVTAMTSPSWTPLFAIASAVVTDAGDALSHVAIAAREYGIPCVAGTGHATVRVPDGAAVTVDGAAGTVHIHDPSPRRPD